MPNHYANQLTVTGKNVSEFKNFASGVGKFWKPTSFQINERFKDEEKIPDNAVEIMRKEHEEGEKELICLENFIPFPEDMDDYSNEGYDWAIENHGTKWGCYDTMIVHETDDKIVYQFNTAWALFNEDVMRAMSEKFPHLSFTLDFMELGCSFIRRCTAFGGSCLGWD